MLVLQGEFVGAVKVEGIVVPVAFLLVEVVASGLCLQDAKLFVDVRLVVSIVRILAVPSVIGVFAYNLQPLERREDGA